MSVSNENVHPNSQEAADRRDLSLKDYKMLEKIGEGTYGVVYKGSCLRTGAIVAMKKIRLENEESGVPQTAIREISSLKEIDHPNVVKLHGVVSQKEKLFLIFEFLSMDLKRKITDMPAGQNFDPMTVRSYLFQVCQAMCYCHQRRFVHRDLKPQNLLVDDKGAIKIADFGLVRAVDVPMKVYTHEVVTLWYRAPEILLGASKYCMAVDMWSIGCIFAEMINKKPLFPGDSEIDQLFRVFRILGTPTELDWEGVSKLPEYKPTFPQWAARNLRDVICDKLGRSLIDDAGLDLLKSFLIYDPWQRISAKRTLKHPYFDSLDTSTLPAGNFRGEMVFGH